MTVMSVREFNANTSKALSRVQAGEVITLTKHGRAFARVVPDTARPERGTPEWQAAYDQMAALLERGVSLGGRATYEERTE